MALCDPANDPVRMPREPRGALAVLQPGGVGAPQHPGEAHAAGQLLPDLAPDHQHLHPSARSMSHPCSKSCAIVTPHQGLSHGEGIIRLFAGVAAFLSYVQPSSALGNSQHVCSAELQHVQALLHFYYWTFLMVNAHRREERGSQERRRQYGHARKQRVCLDRHQRRRSHGEKRRGGRDAS